MRILYCNKFNFAFSGTEIYLFEVMDLMRAQGNEVALFSMADERGKTTAYDHYFVPHVDFKGEKHWLENARLATHAIYSSDARRRLRHMIHEFRPDVAHVRNIYHHLSPSILWELKAQNIPVLYHLNDFKLLCPSYNMVAQDGACERCRGGKFWRVVTERCYPGPLGSGVVLAAEAYTHKWLRTYERCVDRFLAPSRFVRDKLVENGWNAGRIDVLPHFQKVPAGLPENPPQDAPILYFGRLSSEKGLTELLHAIRRVPGVRLQIAGDGPQRVELENLSHDLSLANVEFVGHLGGRELNERIAAARFTILPSRAYETLGKSILESYALGRPVVASDLGSRRELVEEGVTGLLFRPGDVEQLADAISFLSQRPQLAMKMGMAGREFVREHHSPESHYRALSSLYEEMAKSRTGRAISVPGRKPRLRIAFIGGRGVANKYGGIEAYYEEVGERLAQMGHEVTAYCRSYYTPKLSDYHGIRVVRLPAIRTKHLETFVHTLLSTVHVVFSSADIVHYHALGPALFSCIPRIFGKKTLVTVQGLDWQRKKWGRFAAAFLRIGEQGSFRLPNATIVVSHALEQRYREQWGAATTYIPNGTILRKRREGTKLQEWGIEPGQYILFLGRFSPEKNCHLLIEAYENLATDVKLVLAGGGKYADAYTRALNQHRSDKVILLDYLSGDSLEELLTNAMLFVLPSDLEGLSLALLDAMGAGVCVLTSDIPENRELVDGAGFTFRRGDAQDLERMLRLLISDEPVRSAAAERGQKKLIREGYLWPQVAQAVESSYKALMGWTPSLSGCATSEADKQPHTEQVA